MKPQVRILGIDDSPFRFGDKESLVVGALVRAPNYLEAVMRTQVEVDGDDSTERLAEMISSSRYAEQVKAVDVADSTWLTREIDLSSITAVDDNENFALKFVFQFNQDSDKARVDNIEVVGYPE